MSTNPSYGKSRKPNLRRTPSFGAGNSEPGKIIIPSLEAIASNLQIRRRGLSDEQKGILKAYYGRVPCSDLAAYLGVSITILYNNARNLGVHGKSVGGGGFVRIKKIRKIFLDKKHGGVL